MAPRGFHAALLGLGSLALASSATLAAPPPIAAPPAKFVLDEPGVLSARAKQTLEVVLIEHTRLTQEQVVVAIFKDLGGEDLVTRTNLVFSEWRIGQKGRDNGVLLALYWADRKARIEVGYGLEATLTDAKSKRIIEETLVPDLKRGDPDRALLGATIEILNTLESPLLQAGQLQALLKRSGQAGAIEPRREPAPRLPLLFFVGLILFAVVARMRARRDAHFTRAGWYKTSPFGLVTGTGLGGMLGHSRRGGGFGGRSSGWGGGGGSGGGFSGGGGRSGGGGASGSW